VFAGLLQQIIERVEGAEAAAIMGLDGMIVERISPGRCDELDLIAAEYASLLRSTIRTAGDTELGELRELVVAADESILLTRVLSPEYFLLLILSPKGNLGRARFEMRKAQLILEHEFVM
jgi:predicted regulator of Ras-like GTPase activity (Roadblock/LC7/MglB family)